MSIETCRAETGMGFLGRKQPEAFLGFTVQRTNVVSFFRFLASGQWWGHKHFMGGQLPFLRPVASLLSPRVLGQVKAKSEA